MTLRDRLWVLGEQLLGLLLGNAGDLRSRIQQHVLRNPGDWTTEHLKPDIRVARRTFGAATSP
ncbi:hypothetical protein ACIRL2_42555 [Embleya sp. NPDC127516]|uniref:hypothetical protein n=1 Tax=Embleya sp. NPDC127516 TaxID=3363990 RepID=UPI00380224D5